MQLCIPISPVPELEKALTDFYHTDSVIIVDNTVYRIAAANPVILDKMECMELTLEAL